MTDLVKRATLIVRDAEAAAARYEQVFGMTRVWTRRSLCRVRNWRTHRGDRHRRLRLLDVTPGAVRGQVVALYYMAIGIAGLGPGPPTVGILSTRVFGEAHLRSAVACIPLLYGVVPLLPLIARAYRRRLEEMP